MIDSLFNNPISFVLWFISIVIAITVHEFSHALTADKLGDPTPRLQGRLSLNPRAHLDPMGTILLLLVHFGWGKPVEFDPYNLRNPRRDAALISIAGPISNMLLAIASSLLLRLLLLSPLGLMANGIGSLVSPVISGFLVQLTAINVVLAIFNLVPIHPLDGFKIVGGILLQDQAREWYQLEKYGFFFLIFLLIPVFGGTAPISRIIGPIINTLLSILIPSAKII